MSWPRGAWMSCSRGAWVSWPRALAWDFGGAGFLAVAVLAVSNSLASLTSGGQSGAAGARAGVDNDTMETDRERTRDFIESSILLGKLWALEACSRPRKVATRKPEVGERPDVNPRCDPDNRDGVPFSEAASPPHCPLAAPRTPPMAARGTPGHTAAIRGERILNDEDGIGDASVSSPGESWRQAVSRSGGRA